MLLSSNPQSWTVLTSAKTERNQGELFENQNWQPWAGTRDLSPDFFIQPLVSFQRTAPTGVFNYYYYLYLFIYIGAHAIHSTYVETREQLGESVLIFLFIVGPEHLTQVLSSRLARGK